MCSLHVLFQRMACCWPSCLEVVSLGLCSHQNCFYNFTAACKDLHWWQHLRPSIVHPSGTASYFWRYATCLGC